MNSAVVLCEPVRSFPVVVSGIWGRQKAMLFALAEVIYYAAPPLKREGKGGRDLGASIYDVHRIL